MAFFKDVAGVGSLHERMQAAGVGPVALVDSSLVAHALLVRAAASVAVEHDTNGKLLSGDLHTEAIFCLAHSKKVQTSLDLFQASWSVVGDCRPRPCCCCSHCLSS